MRSPAGLVGGVVGRGGVGLARMIWSLEAMARSVCLFHPWTRKVVQRGRKSPTGVSLRLVLLSSVRTSGPVWVWMASR